MREGMLKWHSLIAEVQNSKLENEKSIYVFRCATGAPIRDNFSKFLEKETSQQ